MSVNACLSASAVYILDLYKMKMKKKNTENNFLRNQRNNREKNHLYAGLYCATAMICFFLLLFFRMFSTKTAKNIQKNTLKKVHSEE